MFRELRTRLILAWGDTGVLDTFDDKPIELVGLEVSSAGLNEFFDYILG